MQFGDTLSRLTLARNTWGFLLMTASWKSCAFWVCCRWLGWISGWTCTPWLPAVMHLRGAGVFAPALAQPLWDMPSPLERCGVITLSRDGRRNTCDWPVWRHWGSPRCPRHLDDPCDRVQKHEPARRVVERHFPGVVHYSQVEHITAEVVRGWAARFSQACVVLIGAGPPCQSGLNFDRKGALKDQRSCLFQEVPRIRDEVKRHLVPHLRPYGVGCIDGRPWSWDHEQRAIGCAPLQCDAGSFTWCHRPRLFWCDWEIMESTGFALEEPGDGRPVVLTLDGNQPLHEVVRSGWYKVEPLKSFPTFTSSRPSLVPGRKPAGVKQCSLTELARLGVLTGTGSPPYQYCNSTASWTRKMSCGSLMWRNGSSCWAFPCTTPQGVCRRASARRMATMIAAWLCSGIPGVFLLWRACYRSSSTGLGSSALYPLRTFWIGSGRGIARWHRDVCSVCRWMGRVSPSLIAPPNWLSKLGNMISIKGEDIMLTTPTNQLAKFHRLRATVPARCWRWRVVSGWKWKSLGEHINSLELRAILTSLRWRIEHAHHFKTRFIHLTDSLCGVRWLLYLPFL